MTSTVVGGGGLKKAEKRIGVAIILYLNRGRGSQKIKNVCGLHIRHVTGSTTTIPLTGKEIGYETPWAESAGFVY